MKNKIFWLLIYIISIGLAIYISKPTKNNLPELKEKSFYDSAYYKTIDSLNNLHVIYDKLLKQFNKADSINKLNRDLKINSIKKEYEKIDNFNDVSRQHWFDSVFLANKVYQ